MQIDFINPLPQTGQGNKYCLVVIDAFLKWVEAHPMRNTSSTTAKVLPKQIFSRFGLPDVIYSYQGPHFVGDMVRCMSGIWGKAEVAYCRSPSEFRFSRTNQ